MQLSLVSSEASDAGGGIEPPGQPPPLVLVAVPSAVNEFLQVTLGGPGPPSETKAWLWVAAAWGFYSLAWMYILMVGLPAIDPALVPAGCVYGVAQCFCGLMLVATVRLRWRALYGSQDYSDVLAPE